MSTKFLSPGWRMPRNANQSKSSNYSMEFLTTTRIPDITGLGLGTSVDTFSISLWFNKSNMNYGIVFSTYSGSGSYISSGVAIDLNTDGTIAFYNGANRKTTSAQYSINTWYNLVVTSDGTTVKMYVNGSQVTLDSTTVVARDFTNVWINSAKYSASNFGIIGKIDGVSIFDYALSSSQVTTLYGDSTNGPGNPMALPSPPIAYYPLGTSAWNGQYLAENNAIGDYVFSFDGSNDYINLNSDILFNTNQSFSFSSWVNLDSYSDPYPYLANLKTNVTDGIGIFISNNSSYAGVNVGSTDSSITKGRTTGDISSTFLNSWNNVVVTYNGNGANTLSNFSIYVNGSPVALTTTGNYSTMPNTANNIGRRSNSYHYLDGKLSNVQIFNTALTGAEIETLYNYGSPIKTLANIPQSSNLKAWYKLDASELYNSTTTEWQINDSTATELKAFAFDLKQGSNSANNEKVATYPNNELNDLSSITVSGWIYANDSIAQYDGIYINRSGANYFLINVSNVASDSYSIYAQGKNGTTWFVNSNGGIKKNKWNHIALICESSSIKIYVNGFDETSSSSNNFPGITQTVPFNIGSDGTTRNLDGLMSNFQVWNTNLSDSQVLSLYNNGKPIQTLNDIPQNSNLIGWWQLNDTATFDGTNWNIPDDSGNNNTGVSSNMTQDNLVDTNVSALNGTSSGMSQANLVQSDLQTVAPYSKYALDFDGTADYINIPNSTDFDFGTADFTWSFWLNYQTHANNAGILYTGATSSHYRLKFRYSGQIIFLQNSQSDTQIADLGTNIEGTGWHHISLVRNSGTITTFLDGSQVDSSTRAGDINSGGNDFRIAYNNILFNGQMSNVSIWNTALTSAQVTEIYNEGLPGNLNSHSAYSNLVSWWQLGENSSFDGNDWIVADEKGTNNGTSVSMPVGALVNGVGTTANGLSSGMSEGNLVGDAPYSTANAISTNMVVTSRVSGSGNTP